MITNMEVRHIFPTPVAAFKVPEKFISLIPFLNEIPLRASDPELGLIYGDRSKDSYILHLPEFKELRKYLEDKIKEFAFKYLNLQKENYNITQSWISIKHKSQLHQMHTHPNSVVSGVFYWSSFNGKQPIINFHRIQYSSTWTFRPPFLEEKNIQNEEFSNIGHLELTPGTCILFPSFLPHSVNENYEDEPRKSLAFNSVPLKGMGEEGELTELKYKL